jgi:hypothetical protein
MSSLKCSGCGNVYIVHDNRIGKLCKCGTFIPPAREWPIVEENRRKSEQLRKELFAYLAKKLGAPDANHNRSDPPKH